MKKQAILRTAMYETEDGGKVYVEFGRTEAYDYRVYDNGLIGETYFVRPLNWFDGLKEIKA